VTHPFIVIEGPDGAGTTTHAGLLAQALGGLREREPTGSVWGRTARESLRLGDQGLAAQLFAQDRLEHCRSIRELLALAPVVCDRYLPSSLAYQGEAAGVEEVLRLNAEALVPAVVVWLWVPLAERMERLRQRTVLDRWEGAEEQAVLDVAYRRARRVVEGLWPGRSVDIAGDGPTRDVAAAVEVAVRRVLCAQGTAP
jgi:dTMP kinase